MLTGPGDVRSQGNTGSSRPTANVTRLTYFALVRLGCRRRSSRAICFFGTETFSSLNDLLPGLRKMRGIDEPSLGGRRVPYGRDQERYFTDRGRALHFGWSALKGARDLYNPQPMRGLGFSMLDG